jgi:hypothetical protein
MAGVSNAHKDHHATMTSAYSEHQINFTFPALASGRIRH